MSPLIDEEFMAQDGQAIWQQVHDGLRVFVAKRVANEAEVEDILQEVFLRMHRKLGSLRDPRRLVSWLFQITRNAIADHYRAPARHREVPAGLSADLEADHPASVPSFASESTDAGQLRTELAGCLRPMIDRLSADYRQAVTLVELDGLTQQAAAKRLGLSTSGMKSRVQRGRRRLKAMLEACCEIQLDGRRGVADYRLRDPQSDPCGCSPSRKKPS
jgi:RNA polymerase sigma-70 factor, ECF subfamily